MCLGTFLLWQGAEVEAPQPLLAAAEEEEQAKGRRVLKLTIGLVAQVDLEAVGLLEVVARIILLQAAEALPELSAGVQLTRLAAD